MGQVQGDCRYLSSDKIKGLTFSLKLAFPVKQIACDTVVMPVIRQREAKMGGKPHRKASVVCTDCICGSGRRKRGENTERDRKGHRRAEG